MERLAETAINLINELHTERLQYESEYLPLIISAQKLESYEGSGLEPEEVRELAEYKKDNRIYILPCGIGHEVYVIINWQGEPAIIKSSFQLDMIEIFGKTVFLTMEEAEDAVVKNQYEVL